MYRKFSKHLSFGLGDGLLEGFGGATDDVVGDAEGEAEEARCSEPAAGNCQDFVFLENGTEGHVIGYGGLGEDIEGAFGSHKLIARILEDGAKEIAPAAVD